MMSCRSSRLTDRKSSRPNIQRGSKLSKCRRNRTTSAQGPLRTCMLPFKCTRGKKKLWAKGVIQTIRQPEERIKMEKTRLKIQKSINFENFVVLCSSAKAAMYWLSQNMLLFQNAREKLIITPVLGLGVLLKPDVYWPPNHEGRFSCKASSVAKTQALDLWSKPVGNVRLLRSLKDTDCCWPF